MNTFLKVFLTQRLQFCVYFILDVHNPHIVFDSDLNVTFTINEQSVRLSTLLRNTNLGQIRRNDPSTIMERLWELNPDLVFHFDFVPGIDFSPFLTSTTLIIPL
ncbi:hypothetical protein [Spiroplasma endosymbiont of Aleiodes alternator]|uniref:hypothetical protein n=1 Tax=Spiroplasma endosymbiont of Aleiodes alternator TaxID=3139329 RepID=UPI003CCAF608